MRLNYVEQKFSCLFSIYIGYVVRNPWPFFILPLILTSILSCGLFRHSEAFIKDELYLYTPTNAEAHNELKQLEELFYINDSDPYYANRRYDIRRTGYVIVTSDSEDGDILNPLTIQAAIHLWGIIQTLAIYNEQTKTQINYPSICVQYPIPTQIVNTLKHYVKTDLNAKKASDQLCVSNPILQLFKILPETKNLNISSFLEIENYFLRNNSTKDFSKLNEIFTYESFGILNLLGGVTYSEKEGSVNKPKIAGAKAIMLPYALKHGTKLEDELAEKWELKLAEFLRQFRSPIIQTSWWTYETLAEESAKDRIKLINMLLPCFITVAVYTVLTCCMNSWILSRPFLALGGVVSAAMSISSSVGLLLLLGFQMTSLAYAMPIIIFAVGVDNVFILLSAWRATNSKLAINQRMSKTFGEAAVSITITSLTDLISFGVGCLTPFPSVQMFCFYAVVAIIFIYFYQLTFFASIMFWTSLREIQNRNCFTFRAIESKENFILNSTYLAKTPPTYIQTISTVTDSPRFDHQIGHLRITKWLASLPKNNENLKLPNSNKEFVESLDKNHFLAKFFYTNFSDFILNPICKISIILLYFLYLIIASYGCARLKVGLDVNDLLPENSYGKQTLRIAEKYFSDYNSNLHVWMYNLSKVDFNGKPFWIVLQNEIHRYEYSEFTIEADSWLNVFLKVQKEKVNNFTFIPLLRDFLTLPQYKRYNKDIVFNEEGDFIDVSRVLIYLRNVGSKNQSRAMNLFRNLAKNGGLPTGVYADFFLFAEQYNAVLPGTISSIGIASCAVVAISLIFIPEPLAGIFVALTIVSINIGILGFMAFWCVNLDFISMVTIVMSIGFCVDFAAHLAYNFAKGDNLLSEQRVRNALYFVGTPILQSASSTIIGVLFMATTSTYIFRSFLKTIILVIGFGVLHGLLFLPVLLTIFVKNKRGNWKFFSNLLPTKEKKFFFVKKDMHL